MTPPSPTLDLSTYQKLFDISKRVLGQMNLDRLLDMVIDEAIGLTHAERGFLVLLKGEGLEVRSARNMDKESLKKAREKISATIISEVENSGRALLTTDAALENKLKNAGSVHRMKLRSVLAVPLKEAKTVTGVIVLDNRFASGIFGPHHATLLEAFADQASLAISHARLLKENRSRQKQLEKNQKMVERLNQMLEEQLQDQSEELKRAKLMIQGQSTESPRLDDYHEIIGESKAMKELLQSIDRIRDSDVTVYIQGASGTGKELIARALHRHGPRRDKIFVTTNCASYNDTLLESELFGHVRGAFTGAEKDKKGLFEHAHGGTLFLDEVADMSLNMQAKLLRVLQEGELRPVGSSRNIQVDVRIISATNQDLGEMVKEGTFRKDLFYRLNVVRLKIPPLKDRQSDIPALVRHFMEHNTMGIPQDFLSIEPDAMRALMAYDWPGNIRELENEIHRALVMGKGEIKKDLLSDHIRGTDARSAASSAGDLGERVAEFEKQQITQALQDSKGNKAKAAEQLGISRFTLHQKVKNFGIDSPKRKVSPEEAHRMLQACQGNKAKAAKKLGIRRQTLYYKLERFKAKGTGPSGKKLS